METLVKAPRLLLVITKSNFGGAQRYVFETAVALKKQGYVVTVAAGGAGVLFTKLTEAGITTYELDGAKRDINFLSEIKTLHSLFKLIRDFRPDIIHLNSSKIGLLGSLVGRLLNVPLIVFTAHGWPFLEPRIRTWRTMAWLGSYLTGLLAHRIILVSENDFRQTKMPGVRQKCVVLKTAVADFPLLERNEARAKLFSNDFCNLHAHNIWVGSIGELNHNKNHEASINAVAEFNANNNTKILLTIIGEGDLKNQLQDQASLKGLNDYVQFLGYKDEARQYLSAFDIFLFPSLKEGLPYALLEAGKAGLPCIASAVGGNPEIIVDNESGLLIDPTNHMTIVTALSFLLRNSDQRIKFATKLKEDIAQKFNPEKQLAELLKIYEMKRRT